MITPRIEVARQLAHIKREGLANHIGGFNEWAATIGYSRQHADRLVRFYEHVSGGATV